MEILQVAGLTVLLIVLLGLVGSVMARATTSVNLGMLSGFLTAISGGRRRLSRSMDPLIRGEDPRPGADEKPPRAGS